MTQIAVSVAAPAQAAGRLTVRLATDADRPAISRLRHEVYATELGQHPENPRQSLADPLDAFNHYIVAESGGGVLVGFVSLTPPGHGRYSIDKYIPRGELPFPVDDGLYEVRLLTVVRPFRAGPATPLLMHAALRWIEERGGTRIVALGRREVLGLYGKAGFEPCGRSIRARAVTYELMSTSVERARRFAAERAAAVRRLERSTDWQLPFPLSSPAACEHGGTFFRAIGEDFQTLDRRYAVINADVLDAWFPPPPAVLECLREHLDWTVRTSPPTHGAGLVQTVAATRGVPEDRIVLGGGSSALIYLAFREWLGPRSRVLILDPCYGEYRHVLEQVIGCRVETLPLGRRHGYAVDTAELARRCRAGYDLVVLVNPNNPTGRHVPRGELESLLRDAPVHTRFWIDEAYVDYVGPDQSLERFAATRPNVVVCKSLSKAYALSGLRAAYLCAPAPIARALRAVTPPWPIGLPGQIAAVLALRNPTYYRQRYEQTHRLRTGLSVELERLGIDVTPGTANFLLCHAPAGWPDAETLLKRCEAEGLFLRDVRSMGARFGPRAFRIAVKDAATNRRAVKILEAARHSASSSAVGVRGI